MMPQEGADVAAEATRASITATGSNIPDAASGAPAANTAAPVASSSNPAATTSAPAASSSTPAATRSGEEGGTAAAAAPTGANTSQPQQPRNTQDGTARCCNGYGTRSSNGRLRPPRSRGCLRPPYDGQEGNPCCRTCWFHRGQKHGPTCEASWLAPQQAAEEPPTPSAPPEPEPIDDTQEETPDLVPEEV